MKRIYGQRTDYPIEKISDSAYRIDEFCGANIYLIVGTTQALLIDCGTGYGDLLGKVREITSLPITLVCTHAHVDHIGGRGQFEKLYVHEEDICNFNKLQGGKLIRKGFVLSQKLIPEVKKYSISTKDIKKGPYKTEWVGIKEGHEFDLGDRIIKVKHLPGHSLGSIALIDDKDKICYIGDNACLALWLFVPHHATVEDWVPTGEWIRSMADDYKLYWGHADGVMTKELVDLNLQEAHEVLKKKNSFFNFVKGYPKIDQFGKCLIYTTRKIHNKKKK